MTSSQTSEGRHRRERRAPHPAVDEVAQGQDRERLDRRGRGHEHPGPRLPPDPQAGEGGQEERQERQVRLAQQVRVVDQRDDAERRGDEEDRVPSPEPAPGRQPDREDDGPDQADRVRQDQHDRRPVLAQQAEETEHRRGRGGIHEREEPAGLGVGIDVQAVPEGLADLVPEAVVLVRLARQADGQRDGREDDHQHDKDGDQPAPEPGRVAPGMGAGPCVRASPRPSRGRGGSPPRMSPRPCRPPSPAPWSRRFLSCPASPSLNRPDSHLRES